MDLRGINKAFGVVLKWIKRDVELDVTPIQDNTSVPRGTFAAGQPFTDENGLEHELYCNSHPGKKFRLECDCSARFLTNEQKNI